MNFSAVILAAGASTRLGRPKQTLEIDGRTLLRRAVDTALAAGAIEVIVILGARAEVLRAEVAGLPVRVELNNDWRDGLSSSLRLGIRAVSPDVDAALVMLVDQPDVSAAALNRLTVAFAESAAPIAASLYGDVTGVPAVFARETFPAFASLAGDKGARPLFELFQTTLVAVPEAAVDIDTEQEWHAWERGRPARKRREAS